MRIVSLPWYDLPSAHQALDDFWLLLREALCAQGVERLPHQLHRTTPLQAQWSQLELLLSQCCGLDLFTPATRAVKPIGRPVFDLPCEPGNYFSHIVTTPGTLLGTSLPPERIAINSLSSRSGCTALLSWLKARNWTPHKTLISGSHQASVDLIRRGLADMAAVDAHSWSLIDQGGLEIIGQSAQAPTPPFIGRTEGDVPAPVLLRALQRAVAQGGKEIGIREVLPVNREVYRSLADEAAGLEVPINRS